MFKYVLDVRENKTRSKNALQKVTSTRNVLVITTHGKNVSKLQWPTSHYGNELPKKKGRSNSKEIFERK